MKLNGISKISDTAGDYLVITDYGSEGLGVSHQAHTAEEALKWMLASAYGSQQAIVRLVTTEEISSANIS